MQQQDTHLTESGSKSPVVRMLLDERQRLVTELNRIDRMLAREGISVQASPDGVETATNTKTGRIRNTITKVDALIQVLRKATKPLSQKELVIGIQELGYAFSSRNPSNTLNPLLYGDRKLPSVTKLQNGFVLAEREKEFAEIKAESW